MRIPALARVLAAAALAACSSGGARSGESAGEVDPGPLPATASVPAATDTGRSMEHAATTGMDDSAAVAGRAEARDSNQVFLRMMSDHHEGLAAIADSAMPRLRGDAARSDARALRERQGVEQVRMLDMLSRAYGDSVAPLVMPSDQAMVDAVLRADGPGADPTFYQQVVAHHREGVQMIDRHVPHLSGDVRRMADRMRAERQREIAAFERKARAPAPR